MITLIIVSSIIFIVAISIVGYNLYRMRKFAIEHDAIQYELYQIAVAALYSLIKEYDIPQDQIINGINACRTTYNESLMLDSSPRLPLFEISKSEKEKEIKDV